MPLTQEQIIELIKLVNKTDIGELKIEDGDFSVLIRRKDYARKQVIQQASANPIANVATQTESVQEALTASKTAQAESNRNQDADHNQYFTMKSPMIGTFYRASSPDKEPFIKVGDHVEKGQVLCIIEAMKLFNEIESEITGTVIKVLAENASPVEYDQPLFLIDSQ
jgi:acetyl-CoA carboxylase biotin carboxyl carrier protein